MGQSYHPHPVGYALQYQHYGVELASSGNEMKAGLKHLANPTPAIDNCIFWPLLFILVTSNYFFIYLLVNINPNSHGLPSSIQKFKLAQVLI